MSRIGTFNIQLLKFPETITSAYWKIFTFHTLDKLEYAKYSVRFLGQIPPPTDMTTGGPQRSIFTNRIFCRRVKPNGSNEGQGCERAVLPLELLTWRK